MSYTEVDRANAVKFCEPNLYIRLLRKAYEKAPHLISHVNIEIKPATSDDYYIPASLQHSAFTIKMKNTKTLCDMMSCTSQKEKSVCTIDEPASYYYIGDDQFGVQCQPACFNIHRDMKTVPKDGKPMPHVPRLNYFNDECKIVTSGATYLEKPFYRSEERYAVRLNDMPTGYTQIPNNSNKYGCGLTYKLNETYCGYFDKELKSDDTCGMSELEHIANAIIGMDLINVIQSKIRSTYNDGRPFNDPVLPPFPEKIPEMYTMDGWLNNINKDFKLPDLIDIRPRAYSDIKRRRRRREIEPEYDPHNFTNYLIGDRHSTRPLHERIKLANIQKDKHRTLNNNNRSKRSTTIKEEGNKNADFTTCEKIARNVLLILDHLIRDPRSWEAISVGLVTDELIKGLRVACLKAIESFGARLAVELSLLAGNVSVKVFETTFTAALTKFITLEAVNATSRIASVVLSASVIGWVLVFTSLIGFIISIFDPYGYKNMYTGDAVRKCMDSFEIVTRQQLQTMTIDYTVLHLMNLLNTAEDNVEAHIQTMVDCMVYLNALTVNSDGTVIDKSEVINLTNLNQTDFHAINASAHVTHTRFNQDIFNHYNKNFLRRVHIHSYLKYCIIGSIALSGVMFSINLPILAALLILITLVFYVLSSNNIHNDLGVRAWEEILYFKHGMK